MWSCFSNFLWCAKTTWNCFYKRCTENLEISFTEVSWPLFTKFRNCLIYKITTKPTWNGTKNISLYNLKVHQQILAYYRNFKTNGRKKLLLKRLVPIIRHTGYRTLDILKKAFLPSIMQLSEFFQATFTLTKSTKTCICVIIQATLGQSIFQ